MRVYLPPDANCTLQTVDHCLRSTNYINLVIASKQPMPQWLAPDAAYEHCKTGASIWHWASSGPEQAPDVVLAAAGDNMTLELLAAISLLRREAPELRVRVVNITDLMVLGLRTEHPHGLTEEAFEALFTADRPVIFNFHGYPNAVEALLFQRPNARRFTINGYRYVSGVGTAFIQRLHVAVLLCLGQISSLLLIADGARWIRTFFSDTLALIVGTTMLLDWHHLKQKCQDLSSQICRGKGAKAQLLRRLYRRLWRGDVSGAIAVLEAERPKTKNEAKLDELNGYLQARAVWIPNERQRWLDRQYIGSAQVEKANDLIVARRQKNRGMQWWRCLSPRPLPLVCDGLLAQETSRSPRARSLL